jgi:glycerol-3-phosphate dehydrogenase
MGARTSAPGVSGSRAEEGGFRTAMIDRGRLGPEQRVEHLRRLRSECFDVIVVGGGVTGAGAALDAATRGLSVALLEAGDLAGGTSSRSGKTLHGGLRYLEQGNLKLVREAAHERNLCVELLCPHLARPTPFLFPISHRGWQRPYLGAGVLLYDLLGGARSSRMPWHRHLSRRRALSLCPALDPRRVQGAVQYYDVIFDDARHTMLVARTAVHYGAALATRTPVVEMLHEGGRIVGVRANDEEAGESFGVSGRCIINAAGAWVDRVQELAGDPQVRVQPSKGVHLVVPRDRIQSTVGMVTRTADSVLFVRPWGERFWVIGTTDTPWEHQREQPAASGADIDYLLNEVNTWLARPLTRADIVGVYAGVRPLVSARDGEDGRGTAALSRDHAVLPGPEGMFTIVGGKYTTYRRMAQDVIDAATGWLGGAVPSSVTDRTPLLGAEGWDALRHQRDRLARRLGVSATHVEHLIGRYGTLVEQVIALLETRPPLAEPLPGAPDYLQVEIVYAATHEGARTVEDVLARRTHVSIETADRGMASAEPAAELVGDALGWPPERRRREVAGYRRRLEADRRSELAPDDDEAARAQSPESTRQERCAGSRSSKNRS